MKGVLVNYRMARHRQTTNQMVLKINGYETREKATSLLGKTVVWKSPAGKEIKGKITMQHGNKGAVRILFETGMPGQAIGQEAEII